jgi:peptide/nickel transport system permease protein
VSYIGRRLARALLLLVGVSALCFLFTEMAPGSFFDEMRLNPQISPETISSLRSRYGLDQPLATRYWHWMKSALHGDLGYSIAYNAPVAPLLWSRAKNTLLLTTTALVLTWITSVPLGVWTASRRGRLLDRIVSLTCSFLISVPEIVIAVALLAIAVRWRVLRVGGMMSTDFEGFSAWAKVQDLLLHLALPAFILVLCETAIIVRHVRASILEVMGAPYVQARPGFSSATCCRLQQILPSLSLDFPWPACSADR